MANKEQFDHQFKSRGHTGEHRNGRLSQFKNHNSKGKGRPNEYINENNE
ncbi:hypothetical protein JOD45_001697 [Scopulibacillus daqui]|uniref:Uncharacterized protein n=1 Tax=Scopulibacillus daqui TaxID=1469162 RepID=A0ABS2Q035_9BACL|nr:hypothetical protein [Scopulibacillus daqui]MBM7645486.1 hypothetical protein [Scopulibacillus daqui]